MRVLVAYASRHGATAGIAERVAKRLEASGLEVSLVEAARSQSPEGFDAVVVGGSAYFFHWAKECAAFVRRHADLLRARPTWLFSSGPLGTDRIDAQGRDQLETTIPREFPELTALIAPRGTEVFFGAWDPTQKPSGVMERVSLLMPAVRGALPTGDFRDWPAIDAWADGIAAELRLVPAPAGRG
ncbi:MAG TPA: flavodoxin domain-containing protein [Candidatus Dormibacteraeota bacterium]|nr:flavodoxin domain-containing protein [Candidatus Dormibacteraeota bacterium]